MTMQQSNQLIEALNNYPPDNINDNGTKADIKNGYADYAKAAVTKFVWDAQNTILTAVISAEMNIIKVTIILFDEKLHFDCDCQTRKRLGHCSHISTTLFTIKHTLTPSLFIIRYRPESIEQAWSNQLFVGRKAAIQTINEDHAQPNFAIFLQGQYQPSYYVAKNGEKIDRYHHEYLPKELETLIEYQSFFAEYSLSILAKFFEQFGNRYPVFWKNKDDAQQLTWESQQTILCKTACDISHDYLTLKRVCLDPITQNELLQDIHLFTNQMAINFSDSKIIPLRHHHGWNIWQNYFEIFENFGMQKDHAHKIKCIGKSYELSCTLQLSTNSYNRIPIHFKDKKLPALLSAMVLTANHKPVSINSTALKTKYEITIKEADTDRQTLKIQARTGSLLKNPDSQVYSVFLAVANRHFSFCRTIKRKSLILEAMILIALTSNKLEVQNIIKQALNNSSEFNTKKLKNDAKELLENFHAMLHSPTHSILIIDGQWCHTANDPIKEALLYVIPYRCFGSTIFDKHQKLCELSVATAELYPKLALLYNTLKQKGIPLSLNYKPIKTTELDFEFIVSASSGIDWFEIKPQIRYRGKLLQYNEWQKAITNGGLIETDDMIEILDLNTQDILNSIQLMANNSAGQNDKNKTDIVEIPRLQILDWVALKQRGVRLSLPPEEEKLVNSLTNLTGIETQRIPDKLNATLRPYQHTGYNWLAFLYSHRLGGCLADDMGLGKTVQAITLLAAIKENIIKSHSPAKNNSHLVVVPPSLVFNWEHEFQTFYPDLKVKTYVGVARSLKESLTDTDIVITTYGLVRRDIKQLNKQRFNVIVFDEAQQIKNIKAQTTSAVRQLNAAFKLTLTGTPVENHLGEYFSIMDLCLPGLLGDYDSFKAQLNSEQAMYLDLIIKRTRPFILRRTKQVIIKELPPKMESDVFLNLSDTQKAMYQQTISLIRSTIDSAYQQKTSGQAQIIALTAILKLRQLCVSPRLLDKEITEVSPKISYLLDKVNELLAEGHSALVFSQFTSLLDILEPELIKQKIPYSRLDGSTPQLKRKAMVKSFQDSKEPSIFLLSLKAGGQGLNLTKASYVFHIDPWWNPAVENQASDRAHRIGQQQKVTVIRLLMHHTIEEKIMILKEKKTTLYRTLLEDGASSGQDLKITKEDFDFLLN